MPNDRLAKDQHIEEEGSANSLPELLDWMLPSATYTAASELSTNDHKDALFSSGPRSQPTEDVQDHYEPTMLTPTTFDAVQHATAVTRVHDPDAAVEARQLRTAEFIAGVHHRATALPPNPITHPAERQRLAPENRPPRKRRRRGQDKQKGFVWLNETLPSSSGAASEPPLLCVVSDTFLPYGNQFRGSSGSPKPEWPDSKNELYVNLEPVMPGQPVANSVELWRIHHLKITSFEDALAQVWLTWEGEPIIQRGVRHVLMELARRRGVDRAAVWAAAAWGAEGAPAHGA